MDKIIVIIGSGFAGVECAKAMQWRLPRGWRIVQFNESNHLVFTPLLAEVVGTSINPLHVVWPVRQILRNVDCRTATVTRIDLEKQEVQYRLIDSRPAVQRYDHLVLALGSETHMDVLPGMAAHGWAMKTLGDAVKLRNHLIGRLEQAEVEIDPEVKRHLLSFVVVGGGFSGVEVAGEVNDLLRECCAYYRTIDPSDIRVTLLHSRGHLLPELPQSLGDFCQRKLTKRGVDIRLNVRAEAVTARVVRLTTGEQIDAGTVICTIGNTANSLITSLELPMDRWRVVTEADLRINGLANVWALGDCAAVPNQDDGQISPGTAQFASRHAKQLAKNLLATVKGKSTQPFAYHNRGMFASIGHHTAVGQVFGMKLSGFIAWFLWRGFYLSRMPTFARKLQIAFDWFWDLFFPRDMVQLSMEPTRRLDRAHFEPGHYVFRKGDPANRFYIVERGVAGVYLEDDRPPVALLGPGEHFGERGLMEAGVRTASVKAEEALDVIRIDGGSFKELIGHFDHLRDRMEDVVRRMTATNQFQTSARDEELLQQTSAAQVMVQPVSTIRGEITYSEALERARQENEPAFVVVDDAGKMIGFCSQTDIYRAATSLLPKHTPVREIMHTPVRAVPSSEPLMHVMLRLLNEPIKRLVVVSDEDPDRPVGWISSFEILPLLEKKPEAERKVPAELAVKG